MKKIINNMLYDTEKANKIYEYKHKWFEQSLFMPKGWGFTHWENAEIFKTNKNNYFIYYHDKDYLERERIEIKTEMEVKQIIQDLDVDKYLELFGTIDIEEA